MAEDPDDIARTTLRRAPRLVALPQSAARASRVADDPESTLEELAQAFSLDAALCSHLLKVANSAYYGLRCEVSSIDHAAALLGRKVLRNVALAASMQAIVRRVQVHRSFSVEALWRHSVRSAAGASVVAAVSGRWDPQEAFAAGLIHDLGLLVELECDGQRLAEVLEGLRALEGASRPRAMRVLERRAFGADHQNFGLALCEAWGFPPALRDVAGAHHEPLSLEGPSRTLAAIVRLAETLGAVCEHGQEDGAEGERVDPRLLQELGLDPERLEELAERVDRAGDEVEGAFALARAA